jgi:hypothetical protein
MTARPSRFLVGAGTATLALALGGVPLLALIPAALASGVGTITVHDAATLAEVSANNPKVCGFRLVADGYPATKTSFSYDFQDKTSGLLHVAPGVIALSGGSGQSAVLWLTKDHMYKPHGAGPDENGKDNFKVFKETCDEPVTGGTTGGDTTGTTTGPTDTGGTTGTTTGPTDTGGTTGTTTGPTDTGGTTGTTGDTGGTDTGGSTGVVDTTGTTGGTTGGDTTGDPTLGSGTPVVTPVTHPVTKPAAKPALGSGKNTAAKKLPFTGDRTGELAAWAMALIAAGVGMLSLGQRKPARR